MNSKLLRFALIFAIAFASAGWTGTRMRRSTKAAPPTYIQHLTTTWNTMGTPLTTSAFNVQAGDVLVAYSITADNGTTSSVSGGSLTWTLQQSITGSNLSQVYLWTATVDVNKSMSVSFARGGTAIEYGGGVYTFRHSSGIGSSAKINGAVIAPQVSLTTTQASSAIVVINSDWNAGNGARTWSTAGGLSTFSDMLYNYLVGKYTVYGGFYPNVVVPGTYSVGLTAPLGQQYSIVAIEVRGPP